MSDTLRSDGKGQYYIFLENGWHRLKIRKPEWGGKSRFTIATVPNIGNGLPPMHREHFQTDNPLIDDWCVNVLAGYQLGCWQAEGTNAYGPTRNTKGTDPERTSTAIFIQDNFAIKFEVEKLP